jgi:hypothetical protein
VIEQLGVGLSSALADPGAGDRTDTGSTRSGPGVVRVMATDGVPVGRCGDEGGGGGGNRGEGSPGPVVRVKAYPTAG